MSGNIKLECCICDDEFVQKRTIVCPKCEVIACKTCMKQYIETNGTDACCINDQCGMTWTRRFLTENFGSSYVNGTYKKMIDLNRVDRVLATNSRFMEDAKRYKVMKELEKKKQDANKKSNTIQKERTAAWRRYETEYYSPDADKGKIDKIYKEYHELRKKSYDADMELAKYKEEHKDAKDRFEGKYIHVVGEKVIYQKSCPKQDCKGFLSQNGVCGMCNVHVCGKCQVIKGHTKEEIASHKCNKDDLQSVEAIRKETKPCPRCGTRIHKINGCDQMWCPYCQDKYGEGTTFSWRTGKIERGRIHNPHFLDYMRNRKANLREVGDVHCGGLPELWRLSQKLRPAPYGTYIGEVPYQIKDQVLTILRRLSEINQYIVNPLREKLREQNIHRLNQIKHIIGEIDDKKFRRAISATEKKHEKNQEVLDIFEVVMAVLTEKINQIYNEPNDMNIMMFISFVEEFTKEENRCLSDISFIYKQAVNIVDFGRTNGYDHTKTKIRITTKKQLEYYKQTGKVL